MTVLEPVRAATDEAARRHYVAALRAYADGLDALAAQARRAAILAEGCPFDTARLSYCIGLLATRVTVAQALGVMPPLIYDDRTPSPTSHPRSETAA